MQFHPLIPLSPMQTTSKIVATLLAALLPGIAHAYLDCGNARDEISRDACYSNNADEHWRNSSSYRRIQEYNTQQRLEQLRQEEAAERAQSAESTRRAAEARARQAALDEQERTEKRKAQQKAAENHVSASEKQARELTLRENTLRRLDALAAKAAAKGGPNAADYEALISTAWPYLDLMKLWSDRAAAKLGGRFEFLQGVVAWQGCPEITPFDHALRIVQNGRQQECDGRYHDAAVAQINRSKAHASRFDRLMVCWMHRLWRRVNPVWQGSAESDDQRKRRTAMEECRAGQPDASPQEVDAFMETVDAAATFGNEQFESYFFTFFHPDRDRINASDSAALRRLVQEASYQEAFVRAEFCPGCLKFLNYTAKNKGTTPRWTPYDPGLPLGIGPLTAQEIGFKGDNSLAVLSDSPLPDVAWQDWDISSRELSLQSYQQRENGQYGQSLRFAELQIALSKTQNGADSGRISDALLNVGYTLEQTGRIQVAERAFRRAADRRPDPASLDDPFLRNALSHLTQFLLRTNQRAQAAPYLTQLLRMQTKRLGAAHVDTQATQLQLAKALADAQRWAEISPILAEMKKQLDQRNEYISDMRADMYELQSMIAFAQGDTANGLDELETALRVRRSSLFPENPALYKAVERAEVLLTQQKRPEAAALHEEAVQRKAIYQRLSRQAQPKRAAATPFNATNELQKRYDQAMWAGPYDQAVDAAREWLALVDHAQMDDAIRVSALSAMAYSLHRVNKSADAEPYMARALAYREKTLKENTTPGMNEVYLKLLSPMLDWAIAIAKANKDTAREATHLERRAQVAEMLNGPASAVEQWLAVGERALANNQYKAAQTALFRVLDSAADENKHKATREAARKALIKALEELEWQHLAAQLKQDKLPAAWERTWFEKFFNNPADDRAAKITQAREGLAFAQTNGGDGHALVAMSLSKLGTRLRAYKSTPEEDQEGKALLLKALAVAEDADDPTKLMYDSLLMHVVEQLGNLEPETLELKQKLLKRLRKRYDDTHEIVITTRFEIGHILALKRKYEEADEYYQRALKDLQKNEGWEKNHMYRRILAGMGRAYTGMGKPELAAEAEAKVAEWVRLRDEARKRR